MNSVLSKIRAAAVAQTWPAVIFLLSVLCALGALVLERAVGIGWDFHPDAITYATRSVEQARALWEAGPLYAFNNGHYFLSAAFGQNVHAITALNMFLFGATNVILYHNQKRFLNGMKPWQLFLFFTLLLMNPYRIHLATTILKDTIILFVLVVIMHSALVRLPFVPLLLLWRGAGLLYLLLKAPFRLVLWVAPLALVPVVYFADKIFPAIVTANYANMQFRQFNNVPSFTELDILGIALRAVLWPFLAITGGFFVISPAVAFFPLFLGAVALVIYNLKVHKSISIHWAAYVPMAAFAMLAPGFTTYFRYAFPILVCLPMYLAARKQNSNTLP